MKVVDRSAYLDAAPEKVWAALKKTSTFEYITPRLMGFTVEGTPPEIWAEEGFQIDLRIKALGVFPMWHHTIKVETVDNLNRVIRTREHGGAVKSWRHTMTVEPEGSGTRYRDHVEIDAGFSTPVVWSAAEGLYRYRQKRWRMLAATL